MHESAWSNSFKDVLKKEYGRHLPVVDTKGMIIVSHARRCETTSGQLDQGRIQINKASGLPYKVVAGLATRLANVLTSFYYYQSGRTVLLSLIENTDLGIRRARSLSNLPSTPRQQITLRAVI